MNATYHHNNRSLYIALLISLLFHLSIMMYIAVIDFMHPKHPENNIPTPHELLAEQEKIDNEWVETKTRSSAGAPIFFRDDYQHTIDTKPINDSPEVNNEPETKKIAEHIDATEENDTRTETIEKNIVIKEADTSAESIQTAIAAPVKKTPPPSPRSLVTQTKIKPSIIPAKSTQKRPLPSLAQLTQGMMNYMQEGGNHSVSMLGKKNGRPTDEQLKYERYLERLNQCLHNSFVANSDKQPVHPSENMDVTVFLALNEDGSIYNLKVVKSCGNRSLDLFVLSMLRDASSSFPPVPHYLPHNPFSIHYIITIGSSYYR